MFKRKGDQQDSIHHINIKRGITSHFARTLKVLQQKHLQADVDECIYSNDYSNNLCNALEAVFLHGLKDSVAHKLTAYVGLAQTQDPGASLNFWDVVAKFTHNDVIIQLKQLAQISTDIGFCRAWVRLALNDGLMESYLHSMVVDMKTLKYYYHTYSYLRDPEQPGILKNYLTGLMSLEFRLSYNSSVLNDWNNSTLQLAGLFDPHTAPSPSIRENDVNSGTEKADRRRESKAEVTKESEAQVKDEDSEPIVANRKRAGSKNLASGGDRGGDTERESGQAMFSSIRDVEEIRRSVRPSSSALSQVSMATSEGSSSSRVSCPDPSTFIPRKEMSTEEGGVMSPALYPRHLDDYEPSKDRGNSDSEVSFMSDNIMSSPSVTMVGSPVILEDPLPDTTLAMSPGRPRSRRVSDEDLQVISPKSPSQFALSPEKPGFSMSPSCIIEESIEDAIYNPTHDSTSVLDNKPNTAAETMKHDTIEKFPLHTEQTEANTERMGGNECDNGKTTLTKSSKQDGRSDSYKVSEPSHDSSLSKDQASASSPTKAPVPRTYEEICATLPPLKLDQDEQDAILKKVLKEIDIQAEKERLEREGNLSKATAKSQFLESKAVRQIEIDMQRGKKTHRSGVSRSERESKNFTSREAPSDKINFAESTGGSEASKQFSQTEKSWEEQSQQRPEFGRSSDLDKGSERLVDGEHQEEVTFCPDNLGAGMGEATALISEVEVQEDHFTHSEKEESTPSGQFGNSLGGMQGWSSQIESTPVKQNDKEEKVRADSFASMLSKYVYGSEPRVGSTLDEVLRSLPEEREGDEMDGGTPQVSSPTDEANGLGNYERQDSCLEDFEVLSPTAGSLPGQSGSDSSRMIYLYRVPQEHGLSQQNFTCRGCSRPIGIIYGPPRLCYFDGGLYCFECHENSETHLPSAIVYNWDFSKKKVCQENYKFLQELEDQPLYNLTELNPRLYVHVTELQSIKVLRQQLCYLKSYLFTCSQKVADTLRQKVWPREHLYDKKDLYSVMDLFQVQSGALQKFLKELTRYASQHVYECALCSQKGFVCEICRNPKVIFPFEVDTTVRCGTCKAVYHVTCMTESLPCPKCERWGKRNIAITPDLELEDHPEDYGVSPPTSL